MASQGVKDVVEQAKESWDKEGEIVGGWQSSFKRQESYTRAGLARKRRHPIFSIRAPPRCPPLRKGQAKIIL